MDHIKELYKSNKKIPEMLMTDIEEILRSKKVKYEKPNDYEIVVSNQTKDKLKKMIFVLDYLNENTYKGILQFYNLNNKIVIRQLVS